MSAAKLRGESSPVAVLDELANRLPRPGKMVHLRVPRQLWNDFQELADLHQRYGTNEIIVAMQEHVRRYRADLNTARRAAHQAEMPDEDAAS